MIPLLLIVIPVVTAIFAFALKQADAAKNLSLVSSIATLGVTFFGLCTAKPLFFDAAWLPVLGSSFSLSLDGLSKMLTLLTAISFPVVFASTYNNKYTAANSFYGLMLLTQAGLMGVFLANDCLLFYFFWELALIPVYFLCSIWGGERRIAVTFKFFIYTFLGSLILLIGILYLYFLTPDHSFALKSFTSLKLSALQQNIGFALFFLAFAIKMPIFPLHTWQPDAYEESPTAVTMILSGVMVKMGIYAVLRWLIPVFPIGAQNHAHFVIILSVIGVIYASLVAIKQDDIKRLIAYSSIAHIGLMSAAIFASKSIGLTGVFVQMFNHGINVIGLWIVANAIEQQFGTRKLSELGGIAQKAPTLTILFVILSFSNIALPLTSSFVGEFLMFNGLFQYNVWIAGVAGLSIIFSAVYTLNMVQKVFYGNTSSLTVNTIDATFNVQLILFILVAVIIVFGVFPQPMIDLSRQVIP